MSAAALAHKRDLNKTQHVQVAGLTVWVSVGAKEVSVEDQELSRLAVARRGAKLPQLPLGCALAVDNKQLAAAPDALALQAFNVVERVLEVSLSQQVLALV